MLRHSWYKHKERDGIDFIIGMVFPEKHRSLSQQRDRYRMVIGDKGLEIYAHTQQHGNNVEEMWNGIRGMCPSITTRHMDVHWIAAYKIYALQEAEQSLRCPRTVTFSRKCTIVWGFGFFLFRRHHSPACPSTATTTTTSFGSYHPGRRSALPSLERPTARYGALQGHLPLSPLAIPSMEPGIIHDNIYYQGR